MAPFLAPEESLVSLLIAGSVFLGTLVLTMSGGVLVEGQLGIPAPLNWLFGAMLPLLVGGAWALRNRRFPADNRLPLALAGLAVIVSLLTPSELHWPYFWAYALAMRLCLWTVVTLSSAGLATCLDVIRERLPTGTVVE